MGLYKLCLPKRYPSIYHCLYHSQMIGLIFDYFFLQALMTVIWVVIEIMFLFMFYQLPSAIEPMVVENSSVNGDLNRNTSARQTSSGDGKAGLLVTLGPKPTDKKNILAKSAVGLSSNAGESSPLLRDPQKTPNYSVNRGGAVAGAGREGRAKRPKGRAYVKYVVSQMVQEEIVVLLFVLFITIYTQMVLEVCVCVSVYVHLFV
jgi:hypothetical protein